MSDIDTEVVDSLKALDPERPIREADVTAAPGPAKSGATPLAASRHCQVAFRFPRVAWEIHGRERCRASAACLFGGLHMKLFWRCLAVACIGAGLSTPASADTIATFSVDVTFDIFSGLELTGTFDWNLTSNTVNPDFMLTDFSVPLDLRTFPFQITRTVIAAFSATPEPRGGRIFVRTRLWRPI